MLSQLFIRGVEVCWDRIAQDSYLRAIPAIFSLERLAFHAPVTCFVGENGSGKSTLLEALAIAAGFNPEGGTRNYRFATRDSHSELCEALRLIRGVRAPAGGYFLRAESFYNVATQEEVYARDGHAPSDGLHRRSHGESFLAIAQKYFRPGGLYFLDEPEAALSPQRQLTLLTDMHRCASAGAQFILVTHSPILLGLPGAEILSFDGGAPHPCAYEDTASYQITRLFLTERTRLLQQLLE